MDNNIYRDLILDHYKNPRNFGHLEHASCTAEEYNSACGDRIVMEVELENRKSKIAIRNIKFNGEGCAISQAAASMLTEKVKGMTKEEVMNITPEHIMEMLGTTLTPSRVKCALLPLEVLQKSIG